VGTGQFVFGVLIVVVTAALGAYYAWRQGQTLGRQGKGRFGMNSGRQS